MTITFKRKVNSGWLDQWQLKREDEEEKRALAHVMREQYKDGVNMDEVSDN